MVPDNFCELCGGAWHGAPTGQNSVLILETGEIPDCPGEFASLTRFRSSSPVRESKAVSAGVNVLALQRMLGHTSAKVALDTYADLFDEDLDAVAITFHRRYSPETVGKMWAREADSEN